MSGRAAPSASAPPGQEVDASLGPQAVHRALEVLTLVIDKGPAALSDLARAAGLPPSTAMRMLRALEHWGYVLRLSDGRYVVGERFVQARVWSETPRTEDLMDLSAPIMRRLTQQTSESSYLAVAGSAGTCTFLREVQSPLPIRYVGFDGWEGRTVPLARSVAGEIFESRVPAEGYVVMAAVTDPDSTVIGAPVVTSGGGTVAVLSIAGPSFRLPASAIARHGRAVKASAGELGALLDAR